MGQNDAQRITVNTNKQGLNTSPFHAHKTPDELTLQWTK